MSSYTVDIPTGTERGIRIQCNDHGEYEEFQPGYRRVTFHCEGCGRELELELNDLYEWRDLGELC